MYCCLSNGVTGKATRSFYLVLFTDDETSPSPEESKLLQSASPGELSYNIFFMFYFIIMLLSDSCL